MLPEEAFSHISNLKSKDEKSLLLSASKLSEIQQILGPERTTNELIPFLAITANYPEPVLNTIFREIGEFPFEEYTTNQLLLIFQYFLDFSDLGSFSARNVFCDSLSKVSHRFNSQQINTHLIPFVNSLISSESANSRCCSILLFAQTVDIFDTQGKNAIFMELKKLSNDRIAIVRQAYIKAACQLIKFLKGSMMTTLLMSVAEMSNDTSYSVLCEIPSFLSSYAAYTGKMEKPIEIGSKLLSSSNWRVRAMFASSFSSFYTGDYKPIENLVLRAADDKDDEVKTALAEQLSFLSTLPGFNAEPILAVILTSTNKHVLTAMGSALPNIAKVTKAKLLGQCLSCLVNSESREARLAAIDAINQADLPIEIVRNALDELARSTEWREKVNLAQILPSINGDLSLFVDKLLHDEACNVRKEIIKTLPNLKISNLTKILINLSKSEDYQERETAIWAIMAVEMQKTKEGMEILKTLAKDPVVNVRITLAEAVSQNETEIINILKKDTNEDVMDALIDKL